MAHSFRSATLAAAFATLVAACHDAPPPPQARAETATPGPKEALNRVVERYWEAYLAQDPLRATAVGDHRYDDRVGPLLTPQVLADALAREQQALRDLLAVPRPADGTEAGLTYELFKRQREIAIEGYTYPEELFPVNPFAGVPQEFAAMGGGDGPQTFRSAADYENWLARGTAFAAWTSSAIENLRSGMRRGYLLPRGVVADMLPQLAMLGSDTPANPFYRPLERMPATIAGQDRERLGPRLNEAIKTRILPAYRELHDFLATEYLPLAPAEGGLSRLPLGEAWYAYRVRKFTEAGLTPAEAHKLGLAAVERAQGRLQAALAEAGSAGDARAFFDVLRRDPRSASPASDLMADYRELLARAAAAAPGVLLNPPQIAFEFRSTEPFLAGMAPAATYRAATPDGVFPAALSLNTFYPDELAAVDAEGLLLRNVLPGRGAQTLLQRGLDGLPAFRRFGADPAYVDGWALYAETLGEEMGFYRDPAAKCAAILDELTEDARVVIDTGLNAEGWTRRRASEYLRSELPIDERAASLTIDRALALPAEGLSAAIGALRIRELRTHAEAKLGTRFDLRGFHAAILGEGALPLDLLQERLEAWIGAEGEPASSAASSAEIR
jgi:uncharacterized protein (DUF885 family)